MIFNLSKYASNIAIITDDSTSVTYLELADRVKKISNSLEPGVLQFCLCRNDIDSIVFYLACLEANAPVVLLDADKDKDSIEYLRQIYKPGYTQCNPNLAMCLTTSGSTGSPKFVRLTKQNIISNAEAIIEYLQIDETDRPITMLPMYYSYGLSIINSHLLAGATILLTDKTYAQREFWTFLREHKATSMSGVPYTWEMLKKLRFFKMDLPHVTKMTQAGGKLNPEIAEEYIKWAKSNNKQFIIMYGQTEATARMSYLPWDKAEEKCASIGIPVPGGQFMLAEDGELVYKGPNVCMGYAECIEDLQKDDENNGLLYTGDIARCDEDGYYYITGRKKRFVKVWGNRCNLDQIEQIVKLITPQCACVGVDEKITIFVTDIQNEQAIKDLLLQKTGLNTRAFEVREIENFPISSSGKILYAELSKLL